jgi:PIN domain nuclease of toxin-antitoxin system
MLVAIADTHAAIWYLASDPRLSGAAREMMKSASRNGDWIGVSSIFLVEMVYLVEKSRIPAQRFTQLVNELLDKESVFAEIPVALPIARTLSQVEASAIPDMPDRIIAATALHLKVPVISRDGRIRLSSIQTIW